MTNLGRRLLCGCATLTLPFIASHAAFAQETGAASAPPSPHAEQAAADGVADDIVVTAQRREERLQDVPVAVSVVSGATLARQNIKTLEDLSARLPNVKITSGPLVDQITIRGVGSGQNPGFEQSVATFVDDIYRSRSRSSRAALFDVDRVEVLKGPQSTFFGANAIAGALNITTRKPGTTFGYNASALYAFEDGEYNIEAGVDLPVSDTLGVRVAGRVSGMDGYIKDDYTGNDGPRDRTELGRISVRWQPSSAFRSDFRFDAMRQRTRDGFPIELVGCPSPLAAPGDASNSCARYLAQNGGQIDDKLNHHTASPESFANYDFYEAAWTNALDLGFGSITATTGYFHHKFSNLAHQIPFPLTDVVTGVSGLPTSADEKFHQFSQELRFQSNAGGTLEYMVGGYFSRARVMSNTLAGFYFLPFGAFNPTGTTDATTPVAGRPFVDQHDRTLSAFGSLTIRPVEALRVQLGARYTSVHKHAERLSQMGTSDANLTDFEPFDPITESIFFAILGSDPNPFANPRRTDNKFLPSATVQYDLAHDVMAYASYSKGFKAGGYGTTSEADEFGPETVDAYELGLKSQFFDRRLTLNAALYRSDYKNLQESSLVPGAGGVTILSVQNAASSRSQGVELSSSYRFSRMLTISTDLAYLDAKYRSYPNGSCTIAQQALSSACIQDLSGQRRPYAPEWSGNVTANLTVPVADGYEVRVDPTVYFTSKFFQSATADPLLRQPGNTKLDVHVGFGPDSGRWEIAMVGKNLTDKTTAGARFPVALATGSTYALADRPRAIALQFTVKN